MVSVCRRKNLRVYTFYLYSLILYLTLITNNNHTIIDIHLSLFFSQSNNTHYHITFFYGPHKDISLLRNTREFTKSDSRRQSIRFVRIISIWRTINPDTSGAESSALSNDVFLISRKLTGEI